MAYLANINHETINFYPEQISLIYRPNCSEIRTAHRQGNIYLVIDGRAVQLTTLTAHQVGIGIGKLLPKLMPNELITLEVCKEKFPLLPNVAKQLVAKLLRKADDADDWQLNNRRKLK